MREIVRTPMTLNVLGDEYAGFVGTAEKTQERMDILGRTQEHTFLYPAIMLEREHWIELGMPTKLILILEDL